MVERLRALWARIREWWNRFTTRQKTLIIVGASVVLLTVIILITVFTRPRYAPLITAESTKEASEIIDLLEGENITYQTSRDGLKIDVLEQQISQAELLLGANDIPAVGYSIDNVTSGGFSTTEADKQKKYVLYLESRLENNFIKNFNAIKNAYVELNIPDNDGTLIRSEEEASASILLELTDPQAFTEDNAAYLAKAVATAIGNKTTEQIQIMDTEGNMLFSGGDDATITGMATTQLNTKTKAEALVKKEVKSVLLGTNQYDTVEVATNLVLDFSQREDTTHLYYAPEGQAQGVLSHRDTYAAENVNGTAGVPGTDSNDETTYVIPDNTNSSSTVEEESYDYLPNERITKETSTPGVVDYAQSSVSVTAINYNILREEDARTQGLLDDISWDEYKLANAASQPLEVTDEMIDIVAKATGIARENIAMVAYTEPIFFDREAGVNLTDVLQIILILLILGLLAFVILRSMRQQKSPEDEAVEELSVEQLLESQPDLENLENIEVEESSELKRLIEKFVEDNPEAAAILLRNWLSEDFA